MKASSNHLPSLPLIASLVGCRTGDCRTLARVKDSPVRTNPRHRISRFSSLDAGHLRAGGFAASGRSFRVLNFSQRKQPARNTPRANADVSHSSNPFAVSLHEAAPVADLIQQLRDVQGYLTRRGG